MTACPPTLIRSFSLLIKGFLLNLQQNLLDVLYNKAEQDCVAKAYYRYVEQAITVPTQLDSAYNNFAPYTNIAELPKQALL